MERSNTSTVRRAATQGHYPYAQRGARTNLLRVPGTVATEGVGILQDISLAHQVRGARLRQGVCGAGVSGWGILTRLSPSETFRLRWGRESFGSVRDASMYPLGFQ